VKLKSLVLSSIVFSHKSYISDIKFIPKSVKVDKKNHNETKMTHFVSASEDGMVNIWDTR
jgi:hypothetical protein